jgi:riboflavin biosynthesis pyrimidine reductase
VTAGDTSSSRALEVLWEREPALEPRHRAELPYASALTFPETRPHLLANFVQTIDGVIAFGERGGWNAATVSMDAAIDRQIMALLRAHADAIVIGAGTFRIAHHHQWSPGGVAPDAAGDLDALRVLLRGPAAERAPLYVVTASGRLDPTHVAFTAPETRIAVVTTAVGASRLEGTLPATVEVLALEDDSQLDPVELVRLVTHRSGGLILCEGGPHLLGAFARAGLLDELFLTVAPQIAGRDEDLRRLGLVEGFAAAPDEALRMQLYSLRRAQDHLFLRYRRGEPART